MIKKCIKLDDNGFYVELDFVRMGDIVITDDKERPMFITEKGEWASATRWEIIDNNFIVKDFLIEDYLLKQESVLREIFNNDDITAVASGGAEITKLPTVNKRRGW